jgi:hypothetical protein
MMMMTGGLGEGDFVMTVTHLVPKLLVLPEHGHDLLMDGHLGARRAVKNSGELLVSGLPRSCMEEHHAGLKGLTFML